MGQITLERDSRMLPANALTIHRLIAENGWTYGAELGVRRGDFSAGLCKLNPSLKMIVVDLWAQVESMSEQYDHEGNYRIAMEKLHAYKERVTIIRDLFENAVMEVENTSLDFVYIDGTHTYVELLKDIRLWSRKVKSGGIVSGHDYHSAFDNGGVIRAIEECFTSVSVDEYTSWYAWKANLNLTDSTLSNGR